MAKSKTIEDPVITAAKEIIKERKLSESLSDILERDDLPYDEKMISFITDSLYKLSLVKFILHYEDMLELKGYELEGIRTLIDDVFNLLDAAVDLHTSIR